MSERVASIDILRGLDMAVLTGGAVVLREALTLSAGGDLPDAVAQQFTHAQWGGAFTCWAWWCRETCWGATRGT